MLFDPNKKTQHIHTDKSKMAATLYGEQDYYERDQGIFGTPCFPKGHCSSFKVRYTFDNDFLETYRDFGVGVATKDGLRHRFEKRWMFGDKGSLWLDGEFVEEYRKKWLKSGDIVEVIFDRTTGRLGFKVNDVDFGIATVIEDF